MAVTSRHVSKVFIISDIDGTPQTIIPDIDGDVTITATIIYAVQEITGAGIAGGTTTCVPGANVDLYTDGVDTCNLAISAAGAVTISRTAGADTFNVKLLMVWI